MNESVCPIDKTPLENMTCPKCGREWYVMRAGGEDVLASKPRKVRITQPIEPGKKLDDCLEKVQ